MRNLLLVAMFIMSCTDCSRTQSPSVKASEAAPGNDAIAAVVVHGKTERKTADDEQIKQITAHMMSEWKQQTDIITCNYAEHFCATELKGKVRKSREALQPIAKAIGEAMGMSSIALMTCEREDAVPYQCFIVGEKLIPLNELVAPAQITRVVTGAQWKQLQEQKPPSTKSQN